MARPRPMRRDEVDGEDRDVGDAGQQPQDEERADHGDAGHAEREQGGHGPAEDDDQQHQGDRDGDAPARARSLSMVSPIWRKRLGEPGHFTGPSSRSRGVLGGQRLGPVVALVAAPVAGDRGPAPGSRPRSAAAAATRATSTTRPARPVVGRISSVRACAGLGHCGVVDVPSSAVTSSTTSGSPWPKSSSRTSATWVDSEAGSSNPPVERCSATPHADDPGPATNSTLRARTSRRRRTTKWPRRVSKRRWSVVESIPHF